MRKLLLLTIVMMSVYNPLYAQEYQLKEIEEIAISFLNRKSHDASTRSNTTVTKQIENIEAVIRDGLDYKGYNYWRCMSW